jgi:CRISPR-associated protein Cas2
MSKNLLAQQQPWNRAMPVRRLVIAAYDISAPRRLKRALKHCTGFATGGQKSVHECWVTPSERRALSIGLAKICDPAGDRWMVAEVGAKPSVITLGRARAASPPRDVLFIG